MRLLLTTILFIVPNAESCMPGYEAERDKLREYLGIEWVPEGLNKNVVSFYVCIMYNQCLAYQSAELLLNPSKN
uniref:Secreted protein n=1 Tax=Heterorhabditis bacteriophora TaxID=37862 RepID=A0A1I7XEA6_HETBA